MTKKEMERWDLLIEIAEMYYIKRMSQEEIAQYFDISRSNVSRLLKLCVSNKIVEFKINKNTTRILELENSIKNKYNLKYVKIVSSAEDDLAAKKEAGNAVAEYLTKVLVNGMKVGIAWGSTLYYVVEALNPIIEDMGNVTVHQMVGGTGAFNTDSDGPQLTKLLSNKIGGTPYVMNVPLLLQSKVLRDLLLEEPQVQEHFAKMKDMSLVLMGMGSVIPEQNAMYKAGYISLKEVENVVAEGGVGDLVAHTINKAGEICKTEISNKVITYDIEKILKVNMRLGVAVGNKKTEAVKAILTGGYINILFIDEEIANSII